MDEDVAIPGGLDQRVARTGVSAEDEMFATLLEREAEGGCHGPVINLEGLDRHVSDIHAGAMADLGYLDVEAIDGRSSLVSHSTLELLAPYFKEIADEFLGSSRSDYLMSPRSSLVP